MPQRYDSLSQQKSDFVPRDKDHVTMYFCGPTVYNYIHLGNARPYVISMVAKRYFESLGYRVTLVENITDIDDRIIQKAAAEGRSATEVASEFAKAYIEDTNGLGLGRPDIEPCDTEPASHQARTRPIRSTSRSGRAPNRASPPGRVLGVRVVPDGTSSAQP